MTQKLPRPLALALAALMALGGLTLSATSASAVDGDMATKISATYTDTTNYFSPVIVSWTNPTYSGNGSSSLKIVHREAGSTMPGTEVGLISLWPDRTKPAPTLPSEPQSLTITGGPYAVNTAREFWIVHTYADPATGNWVEATSATYTLNAFVRSGTLISLTGPATVEPGATASYTVSVTPDTATGTVTLKSGGTSIASPGALSSGKYTFAAVNLTPGTHSLTAEYGGDGTYAGSTSSALTVTVTSNVNTALPPGAPPTGLTAKDVQGGVELKWTLPVGSAHSSYTVMWAPLISGSAPTVVTTNLLKTSTSTVIPGLSSASSHAFAVFANYDSSTGFGQSRAASFPPPPGIGGGSSNPPASTAPTAPAAPTPARVQGADRYATAVAISQEAFPEGNVPVTYIVSGVSFADSMAAGAAAAAADGPVLTIPGNSIPASVAAELARLDPEKIVVQGGTSAVSDAVLAQLGQYADTGVTRSAGETRYETAVMAAQTFTKTGETVILTTGGTYPDSLSAASLYASYPGPVMLVEPGGGISDAVAAQIKRLDPARVIILGGTGSVSATVDSQVEALGVDSIRLGGADRYATSSVIAEWVRTTAGYGSEALVATGTNFPDAMTAGALAAVKNAPVMLTNGSCWHVESAATLQRIAPIKLTVLGGSGTQAKSVEAVTVCS